ncbi:MAG: family 16 glycoside hydrolase [Candidatus Diapherotrites archaeon]
MGFGKSGQSSLEYLMLIAGALLVVSTVAGLMFYMANNAKENAQQSIDDLYEQMDSGSGGNKILLTDDFESGEMDSWTIVDEGNKGTPSKWRILNGELQQYSNIYHTPTSKLPADKLGTYAWTGESDWRDYTIYLNLRSTDNDAIGVMFRYKDGDNYYRFSMDRERKYRRLVKNVNGNFTILAEDSVKYKLNQDYLLTIEAIGTNIKVSLDGEKIFEESDPGIPSGSIALYCWGNSGSYFDNILVERI